MLVVATAVLAVLLSLVTSTTIARQKTITMITNFLAYHAPEDKRRSLKVQELNAVQVPTNLAFLLLFVVTFAQGAQAVGAGIAFLVVTIAVLSSPLFQIVLKRRPGSDAVAQGLLADLEKRLEKHRRQNRTEQADAVQSLIEDIHTLVRMGREALAEKQGKSG